jgi:hypothetical protein
MRELHPMADADLPNIGAIIAPLLQRVPRAQQPLLIALAERMAAERYRGWANDPRSHADRDRLLACAAREEEIARRVEGLSANPGAVQQALGEGNPALEELNRSLFAGRPLEQQFTIQANGERLGAATWRAFAEHAESPEVRRVFLGCAELEEESAVVLESIVARGR